MAQRIVAGRYELLERLGTGWRSRDADLGRDVVVLIGDEADAGAAPPAHPSIGRIFDRGEADGEQFAVFEYVPEPSAPTATEPATLIQAPRPSARRRLPPTRMLAIGAGVVLLASAGIGAAFLATADTSSTDDPTTGSLSLPVPTGASEPTTEQSEPSPTTTTEPETTTQEQTTAPPPTAAPPTTTAPPVTVPPTIPPLPTTAPPLPTTAPPPTTEEPPPPTTG